jgi:hypothetical protein
MGSANREREKKSFALLCFPCAAVLRVFLLLFRLSWLGFRLGGIRVVFTAVGSFVMLVVHTNFGSYVGVGWCCNKW